MKNLLFFGVLAVFANSLAAQTEYNPNSHAFLSKFDATGNLYVDANRNVKGTPFLSEQMGHGFAELTNGIRFSAFDLQFDLLANDIYFVMGGNLYRFTDKVKQAQIKYPSADDSTVYTIRSGYPAIATQTKGSLYFVLEDGPRFQLLNYSKKVRVDVANYGSSLTSEYTLEETLYLFDVIQQKIAELSRKTSLSDFMSAEKVGQYLKSHKKPKDREDWKQVVKFLNAG